MELVAIPAEGGITLHVAIQCVPPESTLKGRILCNHGLGDHCGLYRNMAQHLVSHGYEFTVYDQRGSGLSAATDDQVGQTDTGWIMQDLDVIIETLYKTRGKDLPVYMMGFSMGATIATYYAARGKYRHVFTGYICLSPFIDAPTQSLYGRCVKTLLPVLGYLAPHIKFDVKIDPEKETQNPEFRDILKEDPFVRGTVSARMIADCLSRGSCLLCPGFVRDITQPLLMQIGSRDTVVSLDAANRFFDILKSKHKTKLEYDGYYHDLRAHAHSLRQLVFDDIVKWLQSLDPSLKSLAG